MSSRSARDVWRKWRHLDADERRALRQAVFLVPALHIIVRVGGFNRLHNWVARTAPAAHPPLPDDALRTCIVSINRTKRYSPFPGNCLSQSLALVRLLRRRGITPELRLGARLTGTTLDAHAWVEHEGRVLNDTDDVHTRFAPLVRGA